MNRGNAAPASEMPKHDDADIFVDVRDVKLNYKAGDITSALKRACPNGIDVDFENAGGEILDAVLANINLKARIVLCGLISQYNASGPVPGPYNFANVLMKRARIEGFIIIDYLPRFG